MTGNITSTPVVSSNESGWRCEGKVRCDFTWKIPMKSFGVMTKIFIALKVAGFGRVTEFCREGVIVG
jgi:hypothetical protein